MSRKSPFAIQKALQGIGGDPKSVKKLRSGYFIIESMSALQTKSFLLAKIFIDSNLTVTPHKSLNSFCGVISEPGLLYASEGEILEGLSDQGVTQVQRITILKDSTPLPTKHIILSFNSPKLSTTIKAGYLNCKIRPYIPNPLRCFKRQRFGHTQTSRRGQLTCSRCASVGHSSTNCALEPKCVNCSQPHTADSKLCQKWKLENQIQEIKTYHNVSYFEARPLIVPQLTQTYAQATKPPTISTFLPSRHLRLLKKKSTSSLSGIVPTIQSESLLQIPIPTTTTTTSPGNILNTLVSTLETETRSHTTPAKLTSVSTENLSASVHNESNSEHSTAAEAQQFVKRKSRNSRKRPKVQKPDIEIKRVPHRSRNATPTEITTDDEDMITYDVEEGELEQDPPNKFTIDEDPFILPKGYLRALTPSRYRNYRE
ncbi:putative RNA-directed DNA polymerase from transposon BS [Trichonephila clavipes]|nr:putative RNA-directed DNA polymerase from transposon BS [Trichonephila clavipes]